MSLLDSARTLSRPYSVAIAILASMVMPFAPATAQATVTIARGLVRDSVAPGIYVYRAASELDFWTATNSVVVINATDVTVFDSNTRPLTARLIIENIRKLTPKPVRVLINSHWHMDHWSGNDEYARAFPGIQIVATTETRDYMKRMPAPFFTRMAGGSLPQLRASLDSAIKSGKQSDGSPLTASIRAERETEIANTDTLAREAASTPRVLPTLTFRDTLIFFSGSREIRLTRETGDATGVTVMYLPAEKILITGDALVTQENGDGPQPWTTNSNSITPWLKTLRSLEALDADIIVPGQGPVMRDKKFLTLTVKLYASLIEQVHSALARGVVGIDSIQKAINADALGKQYSPASALTTGRFNSLVQSLVRKIYAESLDGLTR